MRSEVLTALSNNIIIFQTVAQCSSAQVTTHILPATCSSETLEHIHHTAWSYIRKGQWLFMYEYPTHS